MWCRKKEVRTQGAVGNCHGAQGSGSSGTRRLQCGARGGSCQRTTMGSPYEGSLLQEEGWESWRALLTPPGSLRVCFGEAPLKEQRVCARVQQRAPQLPFTARGANE